MITFKSPNKARPQLQKYKLAKAFQCFEAKQQSTYDIMVHRGVLHIIIDRDKSLLIDDQKENQVSGTFNHQKSSQQPKKKVGLFANIIKNMDNKKYSQHPLAQVNRFDKPRTYTFYFQELDQRSRKNSQNQSRPNTADVLDNHFEHEKITQELNPQDKRHDNNQEKIAAKADNFVDLNFSFDQISNNINSLKQIASAEPIQNNRNNEDTIIKKYLNENSQEEIRKNQVKLSKGSKAFQKKSIEKLNPLQQDKLQSFHFAKFSKESKIHESSLISPNILLPHSSISKVCIKQSSVLEGTKKVESRIISNYHHTGANSIKIDFDLDINFV